MLFNNFFRQSKVEDILDKFEDDQNQLISYLDLKAIPIGETFQISGDNITTIRLNTDQTDSLSFRVVMQPNQEWGLHKHDCDETIIMYKGICVDLENNNKIKRGAFYFIPKYKKHKITSLDEETIFYVEFKKPN